MGKLICSACLFQQQQPADSISIRAGTICLACIILGFRVYVFDTHALHSMFPTGHSPNANKPSGLGNTLFDCSECDGVQNTILTYLFNTHIITEQSPPMAHRVMFACSLCAYPTASSHPHAPPSHFVSSVVVVVMVSGVARERERESGCSSRLSM